MTENKRREVEIRSILKMAGAEPPKEEKKAPKKQTKGAKK